MNAIAWPGQFPDPGVMTPRFREAGDVTLDLLHRDGRVVDRWLGLSLREFALLWRLAETPGVPVPRQQLLADVWRIPTAPETDSLALHIARVRAKLEPFGLSRLIAVHPEGGYLLDPGCGHGAPFA